MNVVPLPPGPARWPMFGNSFMMPLTYAHIFYKELGKKLGTKIIYLEAAGQPVIVLNDIEIAQELLEKRSALYSSRPQSRMLVEVIGFHALFGMMPYGDEWRMQRRIFQQGFSEKTLPMLQEKGLEFVRKALLANLLVSPDQLYDHVRNYVGGFSTSMVYGLPVQRQRDPLVKFAEDTFIKMIAAGGPGKYLVNVFAPLKYVPEWMPGAGFKKEAKEMSKQFNQLMEDPFQRTVKSMEDGTASPSFVADSLETSAHGLEAELLARYVKQIGVQAFGGEKFFIFLLQDVLLTTRNITAAFETSVAAIMTFILAMLLHPDVQHKAQREVDTVVGPDRLPDFTDMPHFTYLSAVVKEVLSAMLYDEEVFPKPSEFNPERFLSDSGEIREDLPDPERVATFGFGRRICPGAHIARSVIYIAVASMLHLFDISPSCDEEGNPISVIPRFTGASLSSEPLPFPCKVTPRGGKDVAGLLKEFTGTDPI
ncbi:O-methylsterigmatocystin oxidoreductase [Leucoagaricus sp. SymC.cos]|nr:O-methylsterigmatocystin oxidoreductase [Leucoagaricus sp. SymC.cos]